MLGAVVRWCLERPRLVALGAILLLIYGGVVLSRAKFDVFPEFVPAQAEVSTEAPGLTAEQVEQLVTRPVEQAVNGAAGVETVRSVSQQGLSSVSVIFKDGSDPYRARQVVAEALGEVAGALPAGVATPKVTPLTSSTMDLLKIGFTSERLSPMQLRDLVQWTVRPRLLAAEGVARATVYGGQVRRFEVRARPDDLAARDLSLSDLVTAVRSATSASGGGFIDTPEQRILIDARGRAASAADIAAVVIPGPKGAAPTRIGDVADVVDAAAPDVGDAVIMGKPGVLISLSSQYGANTLDATRAVEAAMAALKPALDGQGVQVFANLHRPANFISAALGGITEDLVIGAVLIALVLLFFMRNPRAVLVSFVSIPLSLLTAVIVVDALGWTINAMTLGGLAVALGVVVDDAVIDVENIVRRLRERGARPAAEVVLAAALEVRAPVIYATAVVALVLAPVLMLGGLQGAFFSPLAAAFILATVASLAVAIVVTPPLALLLLGDAAPPSEPRIMERAKLWHEGVLVRASGRPGLAVIGVILALAITGGGFMLFQSELLPSFREGHFVLGVASRPGTSLAVMRRYGEGITRDLLAIDGVQSVEQQIGRASGGEDPFGPERSEFHVELKPGLAGAAQDRIQAAIHKVLDAYPGLETEVMTFLGDRIGESLSGETASLAVGIYGADLDTLDKTAAEIAAVMEKVPGAVDVKVKVPPRAPAVRVELNLPALARYGLAPAEVLDAIQAAYQGEPAAQVYQQDRALDIAVTTPPDLRQDPEAVGTLLVRGQGGRVVALRDIARIDLTDDRTSIDHESGRPRQVVTANPTPRDASKVTKAVQDAIARSVKLPPGVYLEYSGAAEGTASAQRQLLFNIALAAIGVVAVLLITFRGGRSVGLILAAAPFALVGGVLAVAVTGASLSLGSLVGFVTLFGVAARNAILLVSHLDHLVTAEGEPWSLATIARATRERVTPILMTALVTALGVLPLAVQTGQAGREIQGPMAIVILGGLITSTLASLIVLPSLIWRFGRARGAPA
ncbi:efflux RND transporter permease subunit [uncultured Caulobacter sp.]|uniref:efflux RND transporter permease subunit n=1 Tax=uncultured Caulobacter sp. TaxID=158749 RepID=UPI00262D1559|nr:efflux RND transporter permease subunit [uncultured Caulobacter sp.]